MDGNVQRCIRCGQITMVLCTYKPYDQAGHSAPAGKVRIYFYVICERCAAQEKHRNDAIRIMEAQADRVARQLQACWN